LIDRIRGLADRLADHPASFHHLRKIPEWNYRATKARLGAVRERLGAPRVLDAGCGTGEFSPLFDAARYLGVDVHPGYVAYARRLHPGYRYLCADLRTWSSDGERFDLALVNGVLHHLDDADAEALLRAAVRPLESGGTLIVIEDLDLPGASLGARLVHALDHGHFIRDAERWTTLVSGVLPVGSGETYWSGLCPYHWMEAIKP
jgi:SAM-dependent methyltransferase